MDRKNGRELAEKWQAALPSGETPSEVDVTLRSFGYFGSGESRPDETIPLQDVSGDPERRLGGAGKSRVQSGDFEIERQIGRGGMGVVYLARQHGMERDVALKKVRPGLSGDERIVGGMVAEARITGQLEHPNIVPVYTLGIDDGGEVFFVMKLIAGTPWSLLLNPGRCPDRMVRARAEGMSLSAHLEILLKVTDALAFAHARNIIHRDVKPANVMVGDFGEVLLADWGLAADVSDARRDGMPAVHKSDASAPAGTPRYCAPEMALGDGARLGLYSDTYLLGATLYEILAGVPPHEGDGLHEVLANAAAGDIVRPSVRAPGREIPSELENIALKALSADSTGRYADAGAFARAVRAYLTHAESHRLAELGWQRLGELKLAAIEMERGAERRVWEVYGGFGEVVATFSRAMELWSENSSARSGRMEAHVQYAGLALSCGDFNLARIQLASARALGLPDEEFRRLDARRTQLATAREREREERMERHRARIGELLEMLRREPEKLPPNWYQDTVLELVTMKEEQTVELLLPPLDDDNARVRRVAAEALGWMSNASAIEPLIRLFDDGDSEVVAAAVTSVCRLDVGGAYYEPVKKRRERDGKDSNLAQRTLPVFSKYSAELLSADNENLADAGALDLAEKCAAAGDHATLERLTEGLLAKDPENLSALLLRARARKAYDPAGMLKDFERLYVLAENDPAIVGEYSQALALYAGDSDTAFRVLRKAIDRFPDNKNLLKARGVLNFKSADYGAALADFSTVLKIDPDSFHTHLNCAAASGQLFDLERAIWHCNEALRLNPNSSQAYGNRAACYMSLARYDYAEADLKRALGITPAERTLRVKLGYCLLKQDKIAEAEECCGDFAEWREGGIQLAIYALLKTMKGEHAESGELFTRCRRAGLRNSMLPVEYAKFLLNCPDERRRDKKLALELMLDAKEHPEYGDPHFVFHGLAEAYCANGLPREAADAERRAIGLLPKGAAEHLVREFNAALDEYVRAGASASG